VSPCEYPAGKSDSVWCDTCDAKLHAKISVGGASERPCASELFVSSTPGERWGTKKPSLVNKTPRVSGKAYAFEQNSMWGGGKEKTSLLSNTSEGFKNKSVFLSNSAGGSRNTLCIQATLQGF